MQSYSIPGPDFNLVLSAIDQRVPPIYSKRILCFCLPQSSNKEVIVFALRKAITALVQDLPFLAGSLKSLSKELPWRSQLVPGGAAKLTVKDFSERIQWSDLRDANFCHSFLTADELCSTPKIVNTFDNPVDACRIQANFIGGGLLLVTSINHCVCDGVGITHVLEALADKMREVKETNVVHNPATPTSHTEDKWSYDRSAILNGNGAVGDIESYPAYTVSLSDPRVPTHSTVSRTFFISANSLVRLKNLASSLSSHSGAPWISTHDAIVSLVWQAVILARQRAGAFSAQENSMSYLTQPVDCRARLGLPSPYYGNAYYLVRAGLPFDALADVRHGLASAAHALRTEISAVTADKFRELLEITRRIQMERQVKSRAVGELTDWGVFITSCRGMNMYGLDFGEALGPVEAFRLPADGVAPGMHVILPRRRDGACEVMISEAENTIAELRKDEWFGSFAKELG